MTAPASPDPFRDALLAAVPHLRAFARSLCRHQDRADDLVQETLLQAWQHRDSLREADRLKPWLLTILRNAFYLSFRRTCSEVEDVDGVHAGQVAIVASQPMALDFNDSMNALDRLPEDQREAIVLVFVQNMSYDEAAAICGCAVGTLKSRINRARKKLSELLGVTSGSAFETDPAPKAALSASSRWRMTTGS